MKSMRCDELGGACDTVFTANTFEEMAQLSQAHCMERIQNSDPAHLAAMEAMKELMQDPEKMAAWMAERRAAFEAAPEV